MIFSSYKHFIQSFPNRSFPNYFYYTQLLIFFKFYAVSCADQPATGIPFARHHVRRIWHKWPFWLAICISHIIFPSQLNYLMIYFVPLPFPSIVIAPFCSISFNNFVIFDLPKGIYGTISLIDFNIVLLKNL